MNDLNYSQKLNRIRAKLDQTFLFDRPLALPSNYFLSVSVACDIKCPYCPRQIYGDKVDSGFMKFEAFEPMGDMIKSAESVSLYGLGEPFLHPKFFEFLKTCKHKGVTTFTSSHGMTLTPEICNKLIDYGLDELAVSIDAPNARLFNFLREGADYKTVIANIMYLQKLKEERGVKHPKLYIPVTVCKHNVRHLPGLVKLGKKLKADRVIFTDLIILEPIDEHLSVCGTQLLYKYTEKAKRLGEKYGLTVWYFYQKPFPWIKTPESARTGKYGCTAAWNNVIVERKGATKPCCYTPRDMGNLFERGMEKMFLGDEFTDFRRTFLTGQLEDCCYGCGNLISNSAERVEKILEEVEHDLVDPELRPGDRNDLLAQLARFREQAAQHFAQSESEKLVPAMSG